LRSSWTDCYTAMHLTRLRTITEISKYLFPTDLCGQVMASVICSIAMLFSSGSLSWSVFPIPCRRCRDPQR
jgi:hypothetical protein